MASQASGIARSPYDNREARREEGGQEGGCEARREETCRKEGGRVFTDFAGLKAEPEKAITFEELIANNEKFRRTMRHRKIQRPPLRERRLIGYNIRHGEMFVYK